MSHQVLLKNVIDGCIASLTWYLVGFGLAFGDNPKASAGELGRSSQHGCSRLKARHDTSRVCRSAQHTLSPFLARVVNVPSDYLLMIASLSDWLLVLHNRKQPHVVGCVGARTQHTAPCIAYAADRNSFSTFTTKSLQISIVISQS
jgi:hypothetical protein